MITFKENSFFLTTLNTTYAFTITESKHLQHLHYGSKINSEDKKALLEEYLFQPGNSISYSKDFPNIILEDMAQEVSSYGKGDLREAYIEAEDENGIRTIDLLYKSHSIYSEKNKFETLPGSYGGNIETLEIILWDMYQGIELSICYHVFEETDVITRSSKILYKGNKGSKLLKLKKIMSNQLDLWGNHYTVSTFSGAWVREMNLQHTKVTAGNFINSSSCGYSSNRNNPFVMISQDNTSENFGPCYGFNLIYSGNHYTSVSVSGFNKTRVLSGINPSQFEYTLEIDEILELPESVMTYSKTGFSGISRNMHNFVKNHIVRGIWKNKERPILINSWEATYFDFNDTKLLKLAKAAKSAGIELFVLDDGWFGKRNDDTTSLGDWLVNKNKLKGGLSGLANKINSIGMNFGIWVEPEMVNEDSDYYRAHPERVLSIPGKEQSLGRNQMVLDLSQKAVQDDIINAMSDVFNSANITYVKWDMNRNISDSYSIKSLNNRQGETLYKYQIGLYRVLEELTIKFPHILFESCASGGNRFDLGMLCYMPQIWASDNTDALSRLNIQQGYSYGYPQSVISAHVSNVPNHQTLRNISIDTRFNIAAFGLLGYETPLYDLSKTDLEAIEKQIEFYKNWRKLLQFGDFYRIDRPDITNGSSWIVVSKDRKNAIGMIMQSTIIPNTPHLKFKAVGLDPKIQYKFTNYETSHNIKLFGDLINTISPVHIKQDSMVHNIVAGLKQLPGEKEEYKIFGSTLMSAGVSLKQGFAGTGYSDDVRLQHDFNSRLYIMTSI